MKNSRQCPKCGSQEIVIADGFAGATNGVNNILLGATVFSQISVDRYVCCRCGFCEEWVRSTDLEKLRTSKKVIKL